MAGAVAGAAAAVGAATGAATSAATGMAASQGLLHGARVSPHPPSGGQPLNGGRVLQTFPDLPRSYTFPGANDGHMPVPRSPHLDQFRTHAGSAGQVAASVGRQVGIRSISPDKNITISNEQFSMSAPGNVGLVYSLRQRWEGGTSLPSSSDSSAHALKSQPAAEAVLALHRVIQT